MHVRSLSPFLSAALIWLATAAAGADADPLPKVACEAAGVEHAKLTEAGLPDLVKKGPEWVKANLGDQRMEEVARYIRLHEELMFKCGRDKLVALQGLDGDEAGDAKASIDKPPPLPRRKPPVTEASKSRAIPAAASVADRGVAPPPRAQPKPKRKPKVDDAYRPPAKASVSQ